VFWVAGGQLLSAWQERQMPLPALQVADLQGDRIDLQQFRGKPLVLNLWATGAGPAAVRCRCWRPHSRRMMTCSSYSSTRAKPWMRSGFLAGERLMLGNVLLDDDAAASTVLGVQAYPSALFDADGRLRELHLGELTAAGLEHKLRRLR
jgi:hypothetical protein